MPKDWRDWHQHYDNPNSSISLRLELVQRDLRRALSEAPNDENGVVNLITMCAGEGRDVLPVLAEENSGRPVKATLVEYDQTLAQHARTAVEDLQLSAVEVRTADAGTTDTYRDLPPAQVMTVCSVFGNIPFEDTQRTVATLPSLLADDGIVIWTRAGQDKSLAVRKVFLDHGFSELSFSNTTDDMFYVGMYQLTGKRAQPRAPEPCTRMFSFF